MPVNGSCATDFLTFLWPSYILARPGGGWDELTEEAKRTGRIREDGGQIMKRALFLCVAIGASAVISLGASAGHAQSVKPKSPGEIAAASDRIAQRNEDCRRQAREQHLHLVKRYRFMRDCKRH